MYIQSVEKPQGVVKSPEARNSREAMVRSSPKTSGDGEQHFAGAVTFRHET